MKENERTYQQWKELAERYFEAQTTDVEEEALARFLATPASQGKEFDDRKRFRNNCRTSFRQLEHQLKTKK